MGYIRHHAIIVTGTYDKWTENAHDEAVRLCKMHLHKHASPKDIISKIIGPTVNGTTSFFIGPDGSKEGWDTSAAGDSFRDAFVEWLISQKYDDGSSPLSWALIQYGDDNHETEIINHSDA